MLAVSPRPALAASVLVILAATVPFLGGLHGYFLSDDFGLIWLLRDKPLAHFLTLFTAPWTETIYGYRADEIRPTLAFSYWLDARWGAGNPLGYHITSVLLHATNSLLVLTLARRALSLPWPWATFAAVLFGVMPAHAETVVWISGRADSIPSLFMLTGLLAFHLWRTKGGRRWYWLALVACFLSLFSKQSAILLPVLLLGWDVLTGGWSRLRAWPTWAAHAPFAGMTAGYLLLRLVLFGNAVREDAVRSATLGSFAERQSQYALATFTGFEQPVVDPATLAVGAGIALMVIGAAIAVRGRLVSVGLGLRLLYFVPFWWLMTIGPLVVVAYFTARHTYLTSAGIALALGLVLAVLCRMPRIGRGLAFTSAGLLLLGSISLLQATVEKWDAAGRFSSAIAGDVTRELSALPEGGLLVLGAPPTGSDPAMRTWLWGFSVPFVLQPPYQPADATARLQVITRPEVYCCGSSWLQQVREAVDAWAAAPNRPPVVVVGWGPGGQPLLRLSDAEEPALRAQVEALSGAATAGELSGAVDAILRRLGPAQVTFRLN